jgi:hypothetical protein
VPSDFPQSTKWEGEKSTLQWRSLTSMAASHIATCTFEYDSWLLCISSQNIQPRAHHGKNIRPVSTQEHSREHLAGTPQNCQGHPKPGKSEKLSQSRGP